MKTSKKNDYNFYFIFYHLIVEFITTFFIVKIDPSNTFYFCLFIYVFIYLLINHLMAIHKAKIFNGRTK